MAYLVNKTDGTLLTTILDGQTDSTSSSIVLIGKQVTNYGEIQNEDFIHILENFSNSIDPANPLEGQLWWNKSTNVMNVFDGSQWRPVTGMTSGNTTPTNSYVGDQWWDTTNDQYKIWNGTQWTVVGPAFSKLDGVSGAIVETVYDTLANKHIIVSLYHNGNRTSIFSRDAEFTPNVALPGFTSIKTGASFSSEVDAIKFHGTATNADTLGNLTPGQFLRSDVDDTTTGSLTVKGQFNVGDNNELSAFSNGLGQVVLQNNSVNDDIIVKVNIANILTTAITVNGTTGLVTVRSAPTDSLGIATKGYTDSLVNVLRTDTGNYLAANVLTLNNKIDGVQANVTGANVAIANLNTVKAPLNSPALTGVPTTPTAPAGTANTQVASTAFVASAISAFDTSKIYSSASTFVKTYTSNVQTVINNTVVSTAKSTGIETITQPAGDNSTKVSTTNYVDRAIKNFVINGSNYQPTCYVSNLPPDNGVGSDGDFWFQYR